MLDVEHDLLTLPDECHVEYNLLTLPDECQMWSMIFLLFLTNVRCGA